MDEMGFVRKYSGGKGFRYDIIIKLNESETVFPKEKMVMWHSFPDAHASFRKAKTALPQI